jgi:hypothetical protein
MALDLGGSDNILLLKLYIICEFLYEVFIHVVLIKLAKFII